jgi:hypothetical protein
VAGCWLAWGDSESTLARLMQGWADVSWRSGGQTLMPTLDALRRGGVELTNMQMYKFCTPTRSSFMWVSCCC